MNTLISVESKYFRIMYPRCRIEIRIKEMHCITFGPNVGIVKKTYRIRNLIIGEKISKLFGGVEFVFQ